MVRVRSGRGLIGAVRNVAIELGGVVPDAAAWAWRARATAIVLERAFKPSAIYTSSPSHVANVVGWSIARRTRLPWVAELRDLWAQRPDRSGTRLRRLPDRILEPMVFRRAAALVTVSDPLARQLRRLHPGKRILSIPSGIDPDLVAPDDVLVSPMFVILYAGRIYERHQDLGLVLRPLAVAIERGLVEAAAVRLELLLLHPLPEETVRLIDGLGLRQVVTIHGAVPRNEAVRRERSAQVLLHLRWDDPRERGILTGKIFEYLAARRPILSTGRYRDDVVVLLEETGAGAGTTSDEATIKWLADAFAAYRASGSVPFTADDSALEKLDVRATTAAVVAVLDDVTARERLSHQHRRDR